MSPTPQNQAELNKQAIGHVKESAQRAIALSETNRTELSKQATDNVGLSGDVGNLAEHIKELRSELKYWKRLLMTTMGTVILQLIAIIWALSRTGG